MNLTISGHHLEVTPAMREYVVTKLERIKRHFDQVVDVRMLLSIDNQKNKDKRQRAEVGVICLGAAIPCVSCVVGGMHGPRLPTTSRPLFVQGPTAAPVPILTMPSRFFAWVSPGALARGV